MDFLRTKEQVNNMVANSLHESVRKKGDVWEVKSFIEVPKSLINAFVSKAKKESNVDPRENYSDTDLAEMFVSFITTNFMNVESLPVNKLLGETETTSTEVKTEITPEEVTATEEQPEIITAPEAVQPLAGEPTSEIQNEFEENNI